MKFIKFNYNQKKYVGRSVGNKNIMIYIKNILVNLKKNCLFKNNVNYILAKILQSCN